jgi:predicted nucleic acid-binding protein
MGLMVDTNVFIGFEKSGKPIDFSSWESSQKVFISVVIVSELLMGVHRANTEERRQRRSAFVLSFPGSACWSLRSLPHAFMPRSMPNWRRRVK